MVTLVFGFLMRSLLYILVLIALAILVARFGRARRGGGGAPDWGGNRVATGKALNLLQERYARGEISREEFLAMRGDLEKE